MELVRQFSQLVFVHNYTCVIMKPFSLYTYPCSVFTVCCSLFYSLSYENENSVDLVYNDLAWFICFFATGRGGRNFKDSYDTRLYLLCLTPHSSASMAVQAEQLPSEGVDFEKASRIWKDLKRDFRLMTNPDGRGAGSASLINIRRNLRLLSADGMPHLLFDWFVDASRRSIRRRIVPDFWSAFPDEESVEGVAFGRHSLPPPFEKSCLLLLHDAVDKMHEEMKPILAGAKLIDDLGAARTQRGCETLLLETLLGVATTYPKLTLFPVVRCAYRLAFKAFQCLRSKEERRPSAGVAAVASAAMDVDEDEDPDEDEDDDDDDDPLLRYCLLQGGCVIA